MNRVLFYIVAYILGVTTTIAQIKSEQILVKNNNIELPGILTYLKTGVPLIIWVHGSGNIDRNGNQKPMVNANYIKQFRDAINKENIAFFSYDKRTANAKNLKFLKENGVDIIDLVNDVKKVVSHFKTDKRFSEIIVAGHSQGSLIAMLALEKADKYISIAGAGESIDKILTRQISKQSPMLGAVTEKYLKELKETGKIKEVDASLKSIFAKQNQSFLASWIALEPTKEIKKIKVPTLIVNGDKDFQVLTADAENLKKAKPTTSLVIIKNMNHLLKNIEKDEDNMKSYQSPDFPISKELVETVLTFIKK